MNEIWRDIKDYEGLYQVSNLGRVRSLNYNHTDKPYILKTSLRRGYESVILVKAGIKKHFTIHRLVAVAFIENPYNLPTVDHIDRNKTNNSVNNLRWANLETQNINRDIQSIINKQINTPSKSKAVYQYSLDGQFIQEWPSSKEVFRTLNYNHNHIRECCNGRRKTAYGYKWKFKED